MRIADIRKQTRFRHLPVRKNIASARAGQSIVESCLVICLICFIFMMMLQVSEMIAAREVLSYAAACSARSRIVGFNQFMVWKTAHVASIPNAGKMIAPQYVNTDSNIAALTNRFRRGGVLFTNVAVNSSPQTLQYGIERASIPEFMASENEGRARYILDYANWESIHVDPGASQIGDGTIPQIIHVTAQQTYNLWVPFHRAFYADDVVDIQASADMESHYPLYIDDKYW